MNDFWKQIKIWSASVSAYFAPRRHLTALLLKWIALATMLIDHVGAGLLETPGPGRVSAWMDTFAGGEVLDAVLRLIGRSAFPIFAFFVSEGYVHTRSRVRYLVRLLLCAVLSQWQFQNLFYPGSPAIHFNTIFTLALGLLACWTLDERILTPAGKITQGVIFLAADLLAAQLLGCDYGCAGVLTVVLFYLLRDYRPVCSLAIYGILSIASPDEIFSFPAFLLLQCYDGRKGRSLKYLFYVFYPAHLLVLLLLRRFAAGY